MPHSTKKQRIVDDDHQRNNAVVAGNDDSSLASFDDLVDVLPNILAFLPLHDIMSKRRINKKTREAVKMTIVPPTDFPVDSEIRCNRYSGHKYSDGEDPDEELVAETADWTSHHIEIISNFRKLRILEITANASLNGRYPFLFNSFPLLQKLGIKSGCIKWDLEMLAGMPLLKELVSFNNNGLAGNISSLRVLKDTLEKVRIEGCPSVEGNFMDLADFPHLEKLDLFGTAVTGDIRDISTGDFSSLKCLRLPKKVYGGCGYELRRISDAADLVRAVYFLIKQRPTIKFLNKYWYARLSEGSLDWYAAWDDFGLNGTPPFDICFVKAGSRIGYHWTAHDGINLCEVNWLEPEPKKESSDYGKYAEKLNWIDFHVNFYKGFHQPPTEEEYMAFRESEYHTMYMM
jgi:hypothetical protein